MTGLRVTYAGGGTLLAVADGPIGSDLVAAARAVGGRRQGASALVLPAANAATALAGTASVWDPLALRASTNRQEIRRAARGVLARAEELRTADLSEVRQAIAATTLEPRLDDHQALNVALMTIPGGWGACVFDEQGTGKTVSLIGAFDLLVERGDADRLFIVSPKSMVAEWGNEFPRFMGGAYGVAAVEGAAVRRRGVLEGRDDVVVLNYESVAANLHALVQAARRGRVVLAVDESYNVKNPDAGRSAAVAELREWCSHGFVLCGTPAPHSASDLVAQVALVDLGYTFATVRLPNDDPDLLREQVRTAVRRRTLHTRNLKAVVLPDLPARRFTEVPVDLTPAQRRLYDDGASALAHDLQGASEERFERDRTAFVSRRANLLRTCSDPAGVQVGFASTPAKVLALDALLRDLVQERGEKVVLWSYYRNTLQLLSDRYTPYGVARVDGSVTSNADRREAVRRFQEEPDTRLFVGNPAAAGAGLTLHAARYAVYESLGTQAAHHMQSLDRIHRRGQARDVEYVTLLARDTVEEPHYGRLLVKARVQADLLGDPPQQHLTRQAMLAELLGQEGG